jgi:succinate dehydrogenase / fumarate reductase cytochrome b subunit
VSDSATTGGREQSFLERHHFLLRRLHSLTGIVPIGVFLIAHLVTNSSVLWAKALPRGFDRYGDAGVATFQHEVEWINTGVPFLILIEITLWVSIGFHSILGFIYAVKGRPNTGAYAYQSNWRYALQRFSGYFGIFFIFYHIATLRWGWTFLVPGGAKWSHEYASSTLALALRGGEEFTAAGMAVSIFYFLGVSLLIFHFANGLWTAAITWGLTISTAAQRRWAYVCAALGTGLMFAGWSAVISFAFMSPADARLVEDEMRIEKSLGDEVRNPDLSVENADGSASMTLESR